MYQTGRGVPVDHAKAAYWQHKVAKQSNAWRNALRNDKAAAKQGDARVQIKLGNMYDNGGGGPKDHAKAFSWYRKAAVQGSARAQIKLGNMYEYGRGVAKDHVKAAHWYRKAAVQGNARAQSLLGNIYYKSQGVLKDVILAHMWLNIASANGYEHAGKVRDSLERGMSNADIERATALARKCMKPDHKTCGR